MDDKITNSPLNGAQYIQQKLTTGENPVVSDSNIDDSIFNDIVKNYWEEESIEDKTNPYSFSEYVADKLGQKDNKECLEAINDVVHNINNADGNFNLSEKDFEDNEEYYSQLLFKEHLKDSTVEEIAQDIKDIVSSDNPNKEKLITIITSADIYNSGIEMFEIMNQFSHNGSNNIFNLVGSSFSPEDAIEIMEAMGNQACSNMYDRTDWGSEKDKKDLDWKSIQQYLMSNMQGDDSIETNECMRAFANGFIEKSGIIRNEILKYYGESVWTKFVDKVASSEEKAATLKDETYTNLIDNHNYWVSKANGNTKKNGFIEAENDKCYSAATLNCLKASGPKGKELAKEYEERLNESVSNKASYKNLKPGKYSNASNIGYDIEQNYPNGTEIYGSAALGGSVSEYSGNTTLMMGLIDSNIKVEHYERNGLLADKKINDIISTIENSDKETILTASISLSKIDDSHKLENYRGSESIKIEGKHDYSCYPVYNEDNKCIYIKLQDPTDLSKEITITREKFCSIAEYVEWALY